MQSWSSLDVLDKSQGRLFLLLLLALLLVSSWLLVAALLGGRKLIFKRFVNDVIDHLAPGLFLRILRLLYWELRAVESSRIRPAGPYISSKVVRGIDG